MYLIKQGIYSEADSHSTGTFSYNISLKKSILILITEVHKLRMFEKWLHTRFEPVWEKVIGGWREFHN